MINDTNNGESKSVRIEIPGPPQGKQRPRTTRAGIIYTPQQTKLYEAKAKMIFQEEYPDWQPLSGPCRVEITAHFAIPRSYNRKRREDIKAKRERATKKPDIDNLIKIVLDALNGLAYEDDKQVISLSASKKYTSRPDGYVVVKISNIDN